MEKINTDYKGLSRVKAESAYEQRSQLGRYLSLFPVYHEATKRISTLPLNGMLVPNRVPPSTHLYTWVERRTVRVECLSQEHNVRVQGSKPHPLTSELTTRPP